jgi:hypothetical protein
MSRFYVGQRVRLVKAHHAENVGLEGFIEALYPEEWRLNGTSNCRVNYGRPVRGNGTHTDCLEPIIPPGMESLEETLALWQPEGIAA